MNIALDQALAEPALAAAARASGRLSACRLSGRGLRRALMAGIQRLLRSREAIDKINVFPVADGDTGTNLAFTFSAVLNALARLRTGDAGVLLDRVANEAIDGARGNSGAIVAQFLQGVSEAVGQARHLTAEGLALAVRQGAAQARGALSDPREGTILSVIAAFAQALALGQSAGKGDVRAVFAEALLSAHLALANTPNQLAVLRKSGVVDAGAQGFVLLLDGIQEYSDRGDVALDALAAMPAEDGVLAAVAHEGGNPEHRYCTECMVSNANGIDRDGLRKALSDLPCSSLVVAGTRQKLRVHIHADAPASVFELAARFGVVTAQKADDMRAQSWAVARVAVRVAVVTDSAADFPESELERLPLHMVPVRLNFGPVDYLDKVSLTPAQFYAELRNNPMAPRTSQPPPGDFRRMFDFLLSHFDRVVYVGLSRGLSGTLQSGEAAAARFEPGRVSVVDSGNACAGQGLLARYAAEAALAGWDVERIVSAVENMRDRTRTYAILNDLSAAVRGGRVPRLAEPLSRWLRFVPIAHNDARGKLGLAGVLFGRKDLARRFANFLQRKLDLTRRYRILIGHCDCPEQGAALRSALIARIPDIERIEIVDAGSAIAAHAGPGSLVVGVQDYTPPA